MRTFLSTHWKTLVAILVLVFVALLTLSPSAASPELSAQLRRHVEAIATAGQDTAPPEHAARYIETTLEHYGYKTARHAYTAGGVEVRNIEVSLSNVAKGQRPARIFIVGANDNASGAAAVLELARLMRAVSPSPGTELKFVFFVNEKPPWFIGKATGSMRHPPEGHPGIGNFIAFVGTRASSALVGQALAAFRAGPDFPSHGLAAPAYVQGVTLSDHSAYNRPGYPALMITDTAFLRYPYHHTAADTPDQLDYESLARVVGGLANTIGSLAGTARS